MPIGKIRNMIRTRRLKKFNPQRHLNTRFIDAYGGKYSIDNEGRFHGPSEFEGCKVRHVAGIPAKEIYHDLMLKDQGTDHEQWLKERVVPHMLRYGTRPANGKKLLVVFESGPRVGRTQFLSGPLKEIKPDIIEID